jgi:RNA polymerase primary sigma factor
MKRLDVINNHRLTTDDERTYLKQYLREISKYSPLTEHEELSLIHKMRQGDTKAKEKLVKHNLRFVVSVAKQYYSKTVGLNDIINEGNIGLMMALERFDPTKGFKFITYAVWWIRREIVSFVTDKSELVRLPVSKQTELSKIKSVFFKLEQNLGYPPTEFELIKASSKRFNEYDIKLFYAQFVYRDVRLDDRVGDGESVSKGDLLHNDVFDAPDQGLTNVDDNNRMEHLLSCLSKRQVEVICGLYGLNGYQTETINGLSDRLGICVERVRQIKNKSLKILRSNLNSEYINFD